MLSNPIGTLLAWTWTGPNPAFWQLDASNDGGATWIPEANVFGAIDSFDPGIVGLWRVYGQNSSHVRITADSNHLDDT